jgi:hypothetical protein
MIDGRVNVGEEGDKLQAEGIFAIKPSSLSQIRRVLFPVLHGRRNQPVRIPRIAAMAIRAKKISWAIDIYRINPFNPRLWQRKI